MKRIAFWLSLSLLICLACCACAEKPGDTVVISFTITDNSQEAISARVGMVFDSDVFEFVSAQNISRDILNAPPTSTKEQFGLLNMRGLSTGELCRITLRIRDDAVPGRYEITAAVDSVYNLARQQVELPVEGAVVTVSTRSDGRLHRLLRRDNTPSLPH